MKILKRCSTIALNAARPAIAALLLLSAALPIQALAVNFFPVQIWRTGQDGLVNSNFQFDTAGGSRVWSGPSSSAGFNSLFLTDGGPNGDFSFQNTLPDSRDLADGIYTFGFYGDLLGVDVSAARTAAFGDCVFHVIVTGDSAAS